ncbi:hypothetical protein [Colwellia sp. Bg11-28]|uniref:hypothetical protein n=1 Tax=Colwellia sp. Bg11-28 TaxID=2058305 RepID=UPI000C334149|nr:hypothetical protein [Colwellia sp. Bg11-28]PKH88330.1 hypothetical protein CXF79_06085 [Colwellia sp. Bg11-28]
MLWWYGYRCEPDGRVCVRDSFEDPELAKQERNRIRSSEMKVTSRFITTDAKDALEKAEQHFN